jgi:hypothetical protein
VEQRLGKEIARLANIGFMEEEYTSEWAPATFAIAKKNGTIRSKNIRKRRELMKSQRGVKGVI